MQERSGPSILWSMIMWAMRLGLLSVGLGSLYLFSQGEWRLAGTAALAALALFGAQHVARRQALGWIIDNNGERQKVQHWNRGQPVFTPTSRAQRIVEEAELRDERRKRLLWWGVPGWGLSSLATYLLVSNVRYSDGIGAILYLSVLFGGLALLAWLGVFGKELLYLSGWQDMRGAQVFDHTPDRPGLREVERQKAYADGRVATAQEAIRLLNPDR